MADDDEFSPEQRIIVEVLRFTGDPNPEATVRSQRLEAYWLGAHLAPAMARYAAAAVKVLDAYIAAIGKPKPPMREGDTHA